MLSVHGHLTYEQDGRRDPLSFDWRASTYIRHGVSRTALREDRTGRYGAAHAPPRFGLEKILS